MTETFIYLLLAAFAGLTYVLQQQSSKLPERWRTDRILHWIEAAPFVLLSLLVLFTFSSIAGLNEANPVWLSILTFFVLLLILSRRWMLSASLSGVIVILAVMQQVL